MRYKEYHGYKVFENGDIIGIRFNKKLKRTIDSTGYYCHNLKIGRKSKVIRLHRILGILFIDNPNKYPVINHKDGDKLNISLNNLEWCSYSHNSKHSIDMGLGKNPPLHVGEKCRLSKLKEFQVLEIRKSTKSIPDLSIEYNIHIDTISKILNKQTWKHI